jgi:hypothetical protein
MSEKKKNEKLGERSMLFRKINAALMSTVMRENVC